METTMEVMATLSDIYIECKQLDKGWKIVNEMDMLQNEFHSAYDSEWESRNLCENYQSNMKSTNLLKGNCRIEEHGVFRSKEKPTERIGSPDLHSIGNDLWMQLKRIQIPMFSGDKRNYQNWKAAFMACVDTAPATDEYKLLHLRQCLSGEPLNLIENLGHSTAAYEAAKERLERRYGGKRRQVAIYLNDLDNFPQVKPGNVHDMQKFADLLEIAIMKLKETGHQNELGNGFLYAKLQTKLTESMLARYHRWVFETQTPESVFALKTWVFEESEFQTIASETVHGISSTIGSAYIKTPDDSPVYDRQTTLFGAMIDHHITNNVTCSVCGEGHNIEACLKFMKKDVPGRWFAAKRLKLCFRCLGNGHLGKACQNSKLCGQHGCQKLHHTLLHKDTKCYSDKTNMNNNALDTINIGSNNFSAERCTSACTEGNNHSVELPVYTCTSGIYTTGSKGITTTVPVLSTKLDRRRKVDNVDTGSCTSVSVAEKLGNALQSRINVNDRNSVLKTRRITASHNDTKDEDSPRCPMEGNNTTESSKPFQTFA